MSNSLVYRIGPGAYRVVPGQTRTVSLNAQVPVITSNPTVNYFSLSEPENNSICFAGTGMFYFGARYYDPELGIWLSVDPAGQFANAYGYASSHVMMVDPDGELAWFVIPMIVGAVAGAYGGGAAANGSANPADWDFSSGKTWGYMLGGAVIGGASGVLGGAVAGGTTVLPYTGLSIEYGLGWGATAGIAAVSTANSLGMWALTGGKSDITTSLGAVSFNWSQGEFGFLGKKGNSAMENFGYALGAFSNLLDMGKVGSALLQTEKGGLGHSAVTTERGDQIIDFGPDKTRGGLAKAVHNPNGASKWYSRVFSGAPATNRYGFEGATPMAISKVNLSTLKAYGKFLDFMTSKGVLGAKMPYSFLYSSCSVQAGIGLLLGGIPNIAITPWLLEQSVRMWNAGLTPSMVSNSYQFQY